MSPLFLQINGKYDKQKRDPETAASDSDSRTCRIDRLNLVVAEKDSENDSNWIFVAYKWNINLSTKNEYNVLAKLLNPEKCAKPKIVITHKF